jgi:hypothetical protein
MATTRDPDTGQSFVAPLGASIYKQNGNYVYTNGTTDPQYKNDPNWQKVGG